MGEVKVMSPFFPSLPEAEPGVMSDLAKGPPTLKGTTKDWGRPIIIGNLDVRRRAKICEDNERNQTNWGNFVINLCERPFETLGSFQQVRVSLRLS